MTKKNKKKYYTSSTLEQLVQANRMPMLFIGAGLSRRYLKDYPQWDELLHRLAQIIGVSEDVVITARQRVLNLDHNATRAKINRAIAQILTNELENQIITGQKKLSDYFSAQEIETIKKDNVPFIKMLIAKLFNNYEILETPKVKNEIRELIKLQQNVSAVITTNYDTFLEGSLFNNFVCFEEQYQYFQNNSEGIGEIYKIHGSISKPQTLIFNEQDYCEFQKNLRVIVAKILSLLLDFPIIFIGYSLEDENVFEILSTLTECLNKEQLSQIKNNFIYVSYCKNFRGFKEYAHTFTINNKSITCSVIETDNFFVIYKYLQKFQPSLKPETLRKYKRLIRDLIDRSNEGIKKIYVNEGTLDDLKDSNNLIISFGKITDYTGKSLNPYSVNDFVQIVLNQEKIEPQFAKEAINFYLKRSIPTNNYAPMFYFTKLCSDFNQESKLKNLKKHTLNAVRKLKESGVVACSNYKTLKLNISSDSPKYIVIREIIKSYAMDYLTYPEYIDLINIFKNTVKDNPNFTTSIRLAVTYADIK